ncbi:hypothetical protein MTO96_047393 [Rhipicephalus appendiculatus]
MPHDYKLRGHGGPGNEMTLSRKLFSVLQGLLGIVAGLPTTSQVCHEARHANDAYQHLNLVSSSNQLAPSHDGTELLATPIYQRGKTLSTAEDIKQMPHDYKLRGHGGPGNEMTLSRKLISVLQGLLGIAAGLPTTSQVCHEALHANDAYQHLNLVSSSNQLAPSHDGTELLATPIYQRRKTLSTAEDIKQMPHDYKLRGHGGPGNEMTLSRKLISVLQGLLGIAAGLPTTSQVCHEARHANDAYQHLNLVSSSNQLAPSHDGTELLATPIDQRGKTLSTAEDIKQMPHDYKLRGHGGPGNEMTLSRKLFSVLQGLLGIVAGLPTTSQVCHEARHANDAYQHLNLVSSSNQLAPSHDGTELLATPIYQRGKTLSTAEDIKQMPHDYKLRGHGGPGNEMTLSRKLISVLQGLLGIAAGLPTTSQVCHEALHANDAYQHLNLVSSSNQLAPSHDGTELLATPIYQRRKTLSTAEDIKQMPHDYKLRGHGGPGNEMTLSRKLISVLQGLLGIAAGLPTTSQGLLGIAAGLPTTSQVCHEARHANDAYQHLNLVSSSNQLAPSHDGTELLATPIDQRGKTLSTAEDIKQMPHDYKLRGHGGPGNEMTLSRKLFSVLQGLLGIVAGLPTTSQVCHEARHANDAYQHLNLVSSSNQLAPSHDGTELLATPIYQRGKTLSTAEDIKQMPHDYKLRGHGGPGNEMTLSRKLISVLQGLLGIAAGLPTTSQVCHEALHANDAYQHLNLVSSSNQLAPSHDGTELLATPIYQRRKTLSTAEDIKQMPHDYKLRGHGGPGNEMTLSRKLISVLQGLLGIAAGLPTTSQVCHEARHANDAYQHLNLVSSSNQLAPSHDGTELLATPIDQRGKTLSTAEDIKQMPHDYKLRGHGGPGNEMTLSRKLISVLQGLLGIAAGLPTTSQVCHEARHANDAYQHLNLVSSSNQLAPSHDGTELLATPIYQRGKTLSTAEDIKQMPHDYKLRGHGGPGNEMTLSRKLISVLQGLLGIAAGLPTTSQVCHEARHANDAYQHLNLVSSSNQLAPSHDGTELLATPIDQRGKTLSTAEDIKQMPHDYKLRGHGGPGNEMTLSRKLISVLQGLLGIAAGLPTTSQVCHEARHANDAYQHLNLVSSSNQLAPSHDGTELLATPIYQRGKTLSTAEDIKQMPHDYKLRGHGGPGNEMTLSRKLISVLQGLLGIAAGLPTTSQVCHEARHANDAYQHLNLVSSSNQLAPSHDGTELLATPIDQRGKTLSTAEDIKQMPHDYKLRGHGGPGNVVTVSRKLFSVLQGLLGIAAGLPTTSQVFHEARHANDAYLHLNLVSSSNQLAPSHDGTELLATPIDQRRETSSTAEDIKQMPHDYNFRGHGGPGNVVTVSRKLFSVLQGLLGMAAGLPTTSQVCHEARHANDANQHLNLVSSSNQLAPSRDGTELLATPIDQRGETSSAAEDIKQMPHDYNYVGTADPAMQ